MEHLATRIIRAEHGALRAVLLRIQLLLSHHRKACTNPDFGDIRALLFYIDEFPEKLHHPKETDLLFPKIRARAPEMRHMLDRLDTDHLRGEYNIRQIQHQLMEYEIMGECRRARFEQAFARYADFYMDHMEAEETFVLPLAEAMLTAEDWSELDSVFFASDRDPLAGGLAPDAYLPLFSRISGMLPSDFFTGVDVVPPSFSSRTRDHDDARALRVLP